MLFWLEDQLFSYVPVLYSVYPEEKKRMKERRVSGYKKEEK